MISSFEEADWVSGFAGGKPGGENRHLA